MLKYKLNHNIEQTCLSHYLVHTHRFSSHSIVWPPLYHSVYTVLYKTQRLEAWRRAKLGESKIATKFADKTL